MAQVFHPSIQTPYYACIFSSTRHPKGDGYSQMAKRMVELAEQHAGYLGSDSARNGNESGLGITVSYWRSKDAMLQWKQQVEHLEAQRIGRETFYADYHIHIAEVQRQYCMESSTKQFIE